MSKLFFTIPPSATSCTHRLTCRFGRCFCTLCRGLHRRPAPFTSEAKRLFYFFSARFSRFINSLKPQCTDVHCGYFFSLFIILCFFCFALGCIPIILREWVEAFLLLPNFLCFRCPILSIEVTLCAKFICTFALNKVC